MTLAAYSSFYLWPHDNTYFLVIRQKLMFTGTVFVWPVFVMYYFWGCFAVFLWSFDHSYMYYIIMDNFNKIYLIITTCMQMLH